MNAPETQILSIEQANELVVEHQGWAQSIARSVARSWTLDWQMDGLDGAAMEALIFCSRRFQAARGVPFRGYARRRIHEASTEAARKSKGWQRSLSSMSPSDVQAREISAELLNVFPDLRSGDLSFGDDGGDGDVRSAVRKLLVGASIIAARQGLSSASPDEAIDYKRMIEKMANLEPVHQQLLWKIYWEGISMRGLADEWETDELNVIREHKVILEFLQKSFAPAYRARSLKVRPGLRPRAMKLKRTDFKGEFSQFVKSGSGRADG